MLSFDLHKRKLLTVFLLIIFIWSLLGIHWGPGLLHTGGMATAGQVFAAMLQPDFSAEIIALGIESSWITLAYATAGMSLALILALLFGILGSGVLASGKRSRTFMKGTFRGILGFMRAIHELVWALFFVASFGLSPFAAVFALAIPYGGILGRIFADMLNDVPDEPIKALRASGASRLQCLLYGYLPAVKASMISYSMYRFECAVRSSAIMSFVGLGGLGYQIQLSLNDLNYHEVWSFMYFLIVLVVLIDGWSTMLRKRISI
ncbi:PhnE/PtxC family ABC transporter permease [Mesobacillus foraminis]|uniref:PhnE/PtxC family ABC transporter permease n=1 Tax=Mesobacillus foraminis TaxID=279826 RepID=UPI0013CF2566|nr:ABC transporter permease subunit [Mesobacillus foraminis]